MAMWEEEELCESEVLWPEASQDDAALGCSSSSAAPVRRGGVVLEEPRYPGGSQPVDIPKPGARSTWRRDDDDDDNYGTMVPPHVLVSRRRSEEAAAAFAPRSGPGAGPGRARELSHLRHSVLRMTGFIEG